MAKPDDWFNESFRSEYDRQNESLGRFNLALFGKTGVGKSTLLNAIFGEEVARTGIGAARDPGQPPLPGQDRPPRHRRHPGRGDRQGRPRDPPRPGEGDQGEPEAAAVGADPRRLVLRPRAWTAGSRTPRPTSSAGSTSSGLPVIMVLTQVPRRERPLPPGRGDARRADHRPPAADRGRPAVHDVRQARRVRRPASPTVCRKSSMPPFASRRKASTEPSPPRRRSIFPARPPKPRR